VKALLVASLLTVCPFLAGCALTSPSTAHTTVQEVQRKIDAALPPGSTRQEIESWLATQGIESEYTNLHFLLSPTNGHEPWECNYSGTVFGTLRNADRSILGSRNISMYFVLDAEGRLSHRDVWWVNARE
jgi:hypothetical protein